jgi:hypothetical protein
VAGAGAAPRPQPGPGPGFPPGERARLGLIWPSRSSIHPDRPFQSDGGARFSVQQNAGQLPPNPKSHFRFLLHPQPHGKPHFSTRSRTGSRPGQPPPILCAVAGPLAGARAPQRVSTPPSSGLAAVLSHPGPASSPPARFLLRRRHIHPAHPNPTPSFPPSFFLRVVLFGLIRMGKMLGLGFVLADPDGKMEMGLGSLGFGFLSSTRLGLQCSSRSKKNGVHVIFLFFTRSRVLSS